MAEQVKIEDFLRHLSRLGQENPFRPSAYADHLLGAARSTRALDHFKNKITTLGDVSQGANIDGQDCGTSIEALVAATAAHSISTVSSDDVGFQKSVNAVSLQLLILVIFRL